MKIHPKNAEAKKLLRNKKVIEEINRHKWLESEIAGYDIGFEAAAEDWLKKHAGVWVAYHANHKLQLKSLPVPSLTVKQLKQGSVKPIAAKKKRKLK